MSFLKAKTKIIFCDKGFTLVEILVASFIALLVIAAAIGVFVSTVSGEKKVAQLKTVEDNARYAMETMSREIRMAHEISSTMSGECTSTLTFENSEGEVQEYYLSALPGGGQQLRKFVSSDDEPITSPEVNVGELIFCVNDFDALGIQPRASINITLESVDDSSSTISLQTTVSIRIF
jgi:prepilin-type N-terminal cleavage/methylation domain-containing protein